MPDIWHEVERRLLPLTLMFDIEGDIRPEGIMDVSDNVAIADSQPFRLCVKAFGELFELS